MLENKKVGKRYTKQFMLHLVMVTLMVFGGMAPTVSAIGEAQTATSSETNEPVEKELKADTEVPSAVESDAKKEVVKEEPFLKEELEPSVSKDVHAPVVEEQPKEVETQKQTLTILGTTDVHGNLWDWSYEDSAQKNVGLAKVSTFVQETRKQNPNTLLIDNGDNIQGTLLTDDLYNVKPELVNQIHPMIAAMNYMDYDSMTLGNHEFNFGLDLIKKIQNEANFPLLSANTYKKADGQHFVDAYRIKEVNGVKVAILGLTIPHIPVWDGGKVDSLEFKSLREEAKKQVKLLKEKEQADIIVASIHAGLDNRDPEAAAINVIEEVPEIDAYLVGHDHKDIARKIKDSNGTEKPVGGAQDTGTGVVKIDLAVSKTVDTEKWNVESSSVEVVKTAKYPADEKLKTLTNSYHETVNQFIKDPIATATADFLPQEEVKGIPEAQIKPTAMISLINNVQKQVTGADISAAALFKASSSLPAGPVTFATIFDIYKYANTLVGVEITGAQLKNYMERQAAYYNQYQAGDVTVSFNENIRVYNYDMFSGVDYKIDISKPVNSRITDLTYQGKAINDTDSFKLAINNYRYEGLKSDGIITAEPYYSSDPLTLRSAIVDYVKTKGTIDPTEELENNWEIIGADLTHYLRPYIVEQVNLGNIEVKQSDTGRTPNIESLNVNKLIAEGKIPEEIINQKTPFTIMHTNDMHGRMDADLKNNTLGVAKLKTYKDQIQPTLMVDAGDAFQGLPLSNYRQGLDMAAAMNAVGYDAMTVGNYEFDFGYDVAMAYKNALNFPIVSANVYKDGARSFEPYTIVEKAGRKYAIIGLTTPETATKTHPDNVEGVTFTDPIPEAKELLMELKGKADSYVFLSHLGVDETTPTKWRSDTLAKSLSEDPAFSDFDMVILDGHSHTALKEGLRFGNVLLAQTGNYLNNVGIVKADFGKNPSSLNASLTPAASLAELVPDPTVQAIVETAKTNFAEGTSEVVIPYNPFTLNGERDNVRTRETNLGNLISDALYDYGQTGFAHPSDFAVINGGGIRASLLQGPVTKGDVIAVLPFGNIISQVAATGDQVYQLFEHSLRSMPRTDKEGKVILDDNGLPALGANGGFLQASESIRVYYDSTKKGADPEAKTAGERILRVELLNKQTGKYEPLDKKKTYYVTTNDFLAAGGDGFTMLGGEREEGPSMEMIVMDYLKSAGTLRAVSTKGTVDLSKYAMEFPGARIVSMTEEDFLNANKPKPEVPGNNESGIGEETTSPGTGSTGIGNQSNKPAGNQNWNTNTNNQEKISNTERNFPATGEQQGNELLSGFALLALTSVGLWCNSRRKKTS